MKKLIQGIVDFRSHKRPDYCQSFLRLSLGQKPDALFIACSDSRVVPNLFASTEPGDLFVFRNVGNLIPPCNTSANTGIGQSEASAIEFSIINLAVKDIVVCGHSECGAMQALLNENQASLPTNLKDWVKFASPAITAMQKDSKLGSHLSQLNCLSQHNVLQQIEHLKSYPIISQSLSSGSVRIHGWWFDIANADVYSYSSKDHSFKLIDEKEASKILEEIDDPKNTTQVLTNEKNLKAANRTT